MAYQEPQENMKSRFPKGWDEKRIRTVSAHYEKQTEKEIVAEDEAGLTAPVIPELFLRLQSQAKVKHITKDKILKDIRKVRRQFYKKIFGDE
jgi:hypothetical protein